MGQGWAKDFCCTTRRLRPGLSSLDTSSDQSQALQEDRPLIDSSPTTPTPPACAEVSPGSVINLDCGEAAKSKEQSKGDDGGGCSPPEALSAPKNADTGSDSGGPTSSPQVAFSAPADAVARTLPAEAEVESELLEAASTARIRSDAECPEGEQATQPKGKGKGKSKMPPPPKASAAPKAKAALPKPPSGASGGGVGMSALFNKIEAVGKKKDLEEAKEIEDIDMSQIDPSAAGEKVVCPRCKKDVLKDHFDSHMTAHSSEILPWLFLGGKRNLENDQEITVRTNITHVLNLAQEVNLKADINEIATEYNRERDLPFVYKKLNFGDTPDQDILSELESAIEFIHEAHSSNERHNVLVNCVQGISRSASVVLAYLMKYERMSLRAAYDHVRERRAVADPRKEFLDQLAVFECKLFEVDKPTLTGAIVFEGRNLLNVDDAIPLSQPCREPPSTSAPAKEQVVTADPQAESTFIEDISNKPARAAATSYESVSDWYTDENPADSPTKTTSEWYLDGKPRPSTRTSQTEVHVMDEATVQPQS